MTPEQLRQRAHDLLDERGDPLRDAALRAAAPEQRAELLLLLSLLASVGGTAPVRRRLRLPVLAAATLLLGLASFLAAPEPSRPAASLGRVVAYRVEVVTQRRGCTHRIVTETTGGTP